ncbi:MAG: hypothetical protein HOQ01_05035, partial [Lysobacter sp.]|nr:hypothetical protein [Lysobacter sp.]
MAARLSVTLLVAALAIAPGLVRAQSQSPSKDATTTELKDEITRLQSQLREQEALLQSLQQRLEAVEATRLPQQDATTPTPTPTPTSTPPPTSVASTDAEQHAPTSRIHRPPSALPAVEEPPTEGYVRLGDSGNLLKLDVVAQLDMMFDDKLLPDQDLFIPANIPVQGDPFFDSDMQSNLSARQSIVRMDFRRDTPLGVLKVVYKNNFFGDGQDMGFNLQALYGELEAPHYTLLAGYHLSAFTDIDVFPNTLDYEGPNSFTFKYTPQVRWSPTLWRSGESQLTLPLSVEKPDADIAVIGDYAPYSRWPDLVIGLRYATPDWHVQWANLLRDLAVQSAIDDRTRTTEAYATQLTFAAAIFGDDSVQGWASWGKGYANFLQDITGFGLDAAFNTSLELEATDAYAWGMGYTHSWNDTMSSSASYGFLRLNPDANVLIDPASPESTYYASLNFAWQFSERAMLGAEWLWGRKEDLAGATGEAQRLQMTLRYDLNP